MERVIFDCDNTFGLPEKDIDDGLTILYLLGSSAVNLMGLTLTYGNAELAEVVKGTQTFISTFDVALPVYLGAKNGQNRRSDASRFLAEEVAKYPQEITIIATGALTNLLGAVEYYPDFFQKVKRIILMGGILAPLVVNGHGVKELNFSCDPEATAAVLLSAAPLVIMTGHLTAQAYFPRPLIESLVSGDIPQNQWLRQVMDQWCDWNLEHLGMDGFCNWDMTTAIYLEKPELFSDESVWLSSQQDTTTGLMRLTSDPKLGKQVTMPERLLDVQGFNALVITTIQHVLKK